MRRAGLRRLLALAVLLAPGLAHPQGLELPFKTNREMDQDAPAAAVPGQEEDAPAEPVLRQSVSATEVVPGQPLTLSLTLLVPTYLPKPPVWPDVQAANLIVRPHTGGGATSERIGGQTWAGVTRRYDITPMVAGRFSLPPQSIAVSWADPETNETRSTEITTDPVAFAGAVPEAASDLDPFIAATALDLSQEISGTPGDLAPGDSATRRVTAEIAGTSPIMLPPLLAPIEIAGAALYPDEPSVAETGANGRPGGTRTERVTLVAEGGGSGRMPDISLRWFNLESGEIETATVEGVDIAISGPAARSLPPRARLVAGALVLAGLLATALLARALMPRITRWLKARHEARLASEAHAFHVAMQTVRARNHQAFRQALDVWAARMPGRDPRSDPRLQDALLDLGAARYREAGGADEAAAWSTVAGALESARQGDATRATHVSLPPLNPAT